MRARDDRAALAHGKAELGGAAALGPEQADMLSDALTLLCYEDPEGSPQGALLAPAARTMLADDVDSALLCARQQPQYSPLERLVRTLVRARPCVCGMAGALDQHEGAALCMRKAPVGELRPCLAVCIVLSALHVKISWTQNDRAGCACG